MSSNRLQWVVSPKDPKTLSVAEKFRRKFLQNDESLEGVEFGLEPTQNPLANQALLTHFVDETASFSQENRSYASVPQVTGSEGPPACENATNNIVWHVNCLGISEACSRFDNYRICLC